MLVSSSVAYALGITAVVLGMLSYIPYFRDIWLGKTKPHAFSWFIWAVLTGIAYAAQLQKDTGPGTYVTLLTAVACLVISIAGFIQSRQQAYPLFDWLCLAAAAGGLGIWWFADTPLYTVIVITIVDLIGFAPTFRKGWAYPYEETVSIFFISGLKFLIAIPALTEWSVSTLLYTSVIAVANFVFAFMIVARRAMLRHLA